MAILIHFERSDACAEAHGATDKPQRVTVPFDDSDGSWVQLTYDSIRTQDGAIVAELDGDSCWTLVNQDGQRINREDFFSDVIIEFTP